MTATTKLLPRWLFWVGMLIAVTVALLSVRGQIEQQHPVLVLLLVVLGGSMMGGRALGFTLACAGFVVIDYFFQPPFDRISIDKPLDWAALVAFLATAGVTTELLSRARQEARLALRRAGEVESLSKLGATTLRHAEPTAALLELATLVREQLGAAACAVFACEPGDGLSVVARATDGDEGVSADLERDSAERALAEGHGIAQDASGTWTGADPGPSGALVLAEPDVMDARVYAMPLRADARIIGVLVVRGEPVLSFDRARRRFLFALAYYAALGVERMRLVGEVTRSTQLLEANRTKNEILASVSHDLRTPLTTIKVLAQGIEARGDTAAGAIVEQADRLARMVADLLELSRLRAGRYEAEQELNTAEDVIGAAVRRAQGVLGDRTIVPLIDLSSPALVGRFDFVDTLRILGNLLDNAIRHTPSRGVIELSATRDNGWIAFIVSDRGSGVPVGERVRIFEAFYRPASALPDSGHAGLGLSIARALAEAQGGSLEYSERPGGGSEFVLRLPADELMANEATDAGEGGDAESVVPEQREQ